MTPYRLRLVVDAQATLIADRESFDLSQAWHAAAFQRMRTMPRLQDLLARRRRGAKSDMSGEALSESLKAAFTGLAKPAPRGN